LILLILSLSFISQINYLTKSKVMKKFTMYFVTMIVILLSSTIINAQLQVSSDDGKAPALPESRAVLYEQSNSYGLGQASQDFETELDNYDCQGADDFYVPAGLLWTIQTVTATGDQGIKTADINVVNVFIYSDAAGFPAATAIHSLLELTCTDVSGVLTIPFPGGLALEPGHYWISVQDPFPYSTHGQWFWTVTASTYNNTACWRNPGNGFGTGATVWTPLTALNFPQPDFMFRLEGDSTNIILPVPISNWVLYIGIGLILVFALVRFRKMV
jgi:hypothetical protein